MTIDQRRRSMLVACVLAVHGLLAACGGTAAPADAGTADASADAEAGEASVVTVEIVNTGTDTAYLDGSYNIDCGPPYYQLRRAAGGPILNDRPGYFACLCEDCSGASCLGIVDSGPAYVEIPPGGVVRIDWPLVVHSPSVGCGGGCLAAEPAGDGPFELTVHYGRGSITCPTGEAASPADIRGPDGDGGLFVCPFSETRCLVGTRALDRSIEATFTASDGTVRVELP
jgi:hypothetical protein